MRGIWTYLRRDVIRRPAAWIALALVFGIGAGGSMAAMAGARRSATAYARFLRANKAADISTGGIAENLDIEKALDTIEKFPQVLGAERVRIVAGKARIHGKTYSIPDFFAFAPGAGGDLAGKVDIPKILSGRLPTREAGDEAALPVQTADRFNLHIGDSITVILGNPFAPGGREAPVRIVGILAIPGLFQGVTGSAPTGIVVPKGFIDRYPKDIIPTLNGDFYFSQIRLKHGAADDAAFMEALARTPYKHLDVEFTDLQRHDVEKAMHPYSVALWLLGIIGAAIVVVVVGQLLARQVGLGAQDYGVLRALGVGRSQLVALGVARAAVVAFASIPVAIVTAFLLSPLTPIGEARIAEPSPGFAFDAFVIGLGIAGLLVVVSSLAVVPHGEQHGRRVQDTEARHPSGPRSQPPQPPGCRRPLPR